MFLAHVTGQKGSVEAGGSLSVHSGTLFAPPSPGTSKSTTRCSASGSYKNRQGAHQPEKRECLEDCLHRGFHGPEPKVAHITSPCFVLVRSELYGSTELQRHLENVVKLCTQEEQMGLGNI